MQSAGLRRQNRTGDTSSISPLQPNKDHDDGENRPPRFTINLSLPPSERYTHVALELRERLDTSALQGLFDELVGAVVPRFVASFLRLAARLALRRVYSAEETAELRGISRATGIKLYLLVAFNVLLDLLLGCTSGGARVTDPQAAAGGQRSRMLHFRTLDWGMDPLRNLVVELDFVRHDGGPVIATAVTYFGFVGVLTGVRPQLSMSLNFRPHHDRTTLRKRLSFRCHQILVLMGLRPSVSSLLRACLLTPDPSIDRPAAESSTKEAGWAKTNSRLIQAPVLDYVRHKLPLAASTAAYLIFCTPTTAYSMEKDHRSASTAESSTFLTTYNHDLEDERNPANIEAAAHGLAETSSGMELIVASSISRKRRLDRFWGRAVKRHCRKLRPSSNGEVIGLDDLVELVMDPYISNDETHYSVIMDPASGKIVWRRVFPPPDSSDSDGE